jgi:lysophospholipase L1-like esterase
MRQNLSQRILRLLIRHSSFTKFIFLLYYSHITKGAIAAIALSNGLENTIIGFAGNEAFNHKGGSVVAKRVIANLEKDFALPVYNRPLKIMPLGDSITYGVMGTDDKDSGGYRTELWKKFVAAGLKVEFVGSQSNGPNSLNNKYHEGHRGWAIRKIAASVNTWLNISQPDLILLMIGTNDARNNSLTTMINQFSALIDQITSQSPRAQLLVASIPPVHPAAQPPLRTLRTIYFNTAIPAIVESKVAEGKKVHFVDMRSLTVNELTSSLSLDMDNGVHPNAQGYRKIANFWYDAVIKVISNQQTSPISAWYDITHQL